MKHTFLVLILIAIFSIGVSFPLRGSSAQFIDRVIRPCSSGATSRAQVVANPNNTGNVTITTCTGGIVTINGIAVVPGGGTTINASNNVLPKRLNAFAFTDSLISDNGTTVTINAPGGNVISNAVRFIHNGNTEFNGTVTPSLATPGGTDIGTLALPFASIFVGTVATNNIQITGTATAARVQTLPDLTGTFALLANNLGSFAATTSAQLAGVISDENGTGAALFNNATSPTFLTGLTVPAIFGGTANGATLTLRGSSGAAPAASYVIMNPQTVAGISPGGLFIGAPVSESLDTAGISDQLHIQGSDAKETNVVIDAYGVGVNGKLIGRSADGTFASKVATSINHSLLGLTGRGYQTTTNTFTGDTVAIALRSSEAYTSTAQGSHVIVFTTLIGTTSIAERFRITDTGTINLNSATFYSTTTPGIAGNGTLNANSDDSAGKITSTGTGASTVVLTFATTFTRAPACFVTNETTSNLVRPVSTTTTLTVNATVVTGDSISYICLGY